MEYKDITMKRPLMIERVVSIHYFEYATDFTFSGEVHNFWEVVYADRSGLMVTAGPREIMLKPGQFFLHRPGEFHNVRPLPGEAANSMIFSFYCSCEKLYSLAGKVLSVDETQRAYLAQIVAHAKTAFTTPLGDIYATRLVRARQVPFGAEQLIALNMEMFLIDCLRTHENRAFTVSPLRFVGDPQAAKICDYLERHVTDSITYEDLCARFSISTTRLKALFRQKVGCGVMKYFSACKIDCAKHLIREKEKNLSEIAEYLGYSSLPHFSRAFKEEVHMTPSQYAISVQSAEPGERTK